jgi:hypothetical protein
MVLAVICNGEEKRFEGMDREGSKINDLDMLS